MASVAAAQPAVPHPDQLQFPSFTYQPPRAAQYRVKLANGMIAYLVPDGVERYIAKRGLYAAEPGADPGAL